MNPIMTAIQYRLYEMTDPYVAEFCQPKMALKIPQPPPPLSSGLPNYTHGCVNLRSRWVKRERGGGTE
jgi:hypothetical protein